MCIKFTNIQNDTSVHHLINSLSYGLKKKKSKGLHEDKTRHRVLLSTATHIPVTVCEVGVMGIETALTEASSCS